MSEVRLVWSVPSPRRTGIITLCPCLCSKGTSRSHVPADCHAPCTRTKVDMGEECTSLELCPVGRTVDEFYQKQLIAPWAQSLVPETCRCTALFASLVKDSVWRAKADFPLVPLCPVKSMAPVLAIAGMVARGSRYDVPLTPLGRFSKPFVTGPNRIPFFNEESSDDDRQVVAEPEGEERLGTAIAIGGSRTGSSSSACGRNRCREQRALRCRATRPRSRTGTPI